MLNYILFGMLACFWGGSFVAIKYLIHEVPSFTAAFYRVAFSVLFLLIIYSRKLKLPYGFWGKELVASSLAGLCSIGIPFALLFLGEASIAPSLAGIINGTVPFWTLVVGILFFGELQNLTFQKIIGLVLGFSGMLLIFAPKLASQGAQSELLGLLCVVGMALFYSIGINLNNRILCHNKIITGHINTIVQQVASVILLFIVVMLTDGVPQVELLLNPTNGLSVLYLSLFSTCIAFIIFYHLIKEIGAVRASTVTFFVPAVAMTLDSLIYGTKLGILELVGASTIIVSMVFLRNRKTATTKSRFVSISALKSLFKI